MNMASDAAYVAGYWSSRAESADACAGRLTRFLRSLADIHPLLASWYLKTHTRVTAAVPVEMTPGAVLELMLRGRARRDDDGVVLGELGFRVGMWNGREAQIGLSVTCGAAPQVNDFGNAVVLELPEPIDAGAELYSRDVGRAIIDATIVSWDPLWATWTSNELRRAQQPAPGDIVVGWETYLAWPGAVASKVLPPEVAIESVGQGVLIAIGDDPTTVSVAVATAVRDGLGNCATPSNWRAGGRTDMRTTG